MGPPNGLEDGHKPTHGLHCGICQSEWHAISVHRIYDDFLSVLP